MPLFRRLLLTIPLAFSLVILGAAQPQPPQSDARSVVVDDFERYAVGGVPSGWQYDKNRNLIPLSDEHNDPDQYFRVEQERGNKFVRSHTAGEAHRIFLSNGHGYDWDVREHPRLRWRWRAMKLPAEAREDHSDQNDTGGALYVTFGRNWLGQPRSIKYTYSSTLPVGTVATYGGGNLKVVVAASGAEQGTGRWITTERDVVEDYRRLFGSAPDDRPITLLIWSDSDDTGDSATVDFDDIALLK